jgi:MFS transporter, OFA family, oxalate/formate antiporter
MLAKVSKTAWTVLWAALSINFLSGILYIWSIIGKALMRDLHWSSLASSLPYTVFSLSFALAMALVGPVQDRKGPRFVCTIGSIFIGCGLIVTGLVLHPVVMILSFGVMTGGGTGALYSATVPPPLKWFPPENKGAINGITVGVVAFSSLMYSPLTNGLVNNIGISPTFLSLGVGLLILMTGLAQLLKNPKEEDTAGGVGSEAEQGAI